MSSDDKTSYFLFVLHDSFDGRYLKVLSMDMKDGQIQYDPHPFDFFPFREEEITDEDGLDKETICQEHNTNELKRAYEMLDSVKKTLQTIPTSQEYNNQKDYFENIIGEYRAWFDKNNIALPEKGFRQSDDYRTIRLDGIKYYPTAKQAEIIKLLHKNHLNGTSDISQHTIITQLEGDEKETSYKRLKDFFKTDDHSKEIYKVFVRIGERKGTFRLNI
tara:strand:- start:657 stop:1310 length:654 start_codon:yes stop_codon:yes gene_type:complete